MEQRTTLSEVPPVSLHGTLETFALPDVLALLAATKKSGELRVIGGATDGRVWFDAGAVVGSEVGRAVTPVDAVFELLRLETGKFSFDAEKVASSPSEPSAIEPLLAEAQSRLEEWKSIEAVIPSLDHGVELVSEVRDPHVMVTGDQWRALVGVAAAPSVTGVVERLGIGEFATCRTLKGLVEAGLVTVAERVAPKAPPAPAAAPAPAPVPVPEPAPAPQAEELPAEEPVKATPKAISIPAQLEPASGPDKPKIKALTSTPAVTAAALEAAEAPAPAPAPATAPTEGEADELVRQVAAMEVPASAPVAADEAPEAPAEAPAEAAEPPAAEAPTTAEGDEPINRGLLLKFLSSVRT